MYCKKCGAKVEEGNNICPNCGFENVNATIQMEEEVHFNEEKKESKYKLSGWCWGAIASLICGCFTFYKGIDKMINYNSGDYYPYKAVNAYVGGDAYNYIINGTHATAFFVLTTMFAMMAIGLLIIHYISKKNL